MQGIGMLGNESGVPADELFENPPIDQSVAGRVLLPWERCNQERWGSSIKRTAGRRALQLTVLARCQSAMETPG